MSTQPDAVCDLIVKAMADGCAIPFLGAGAGLPGRPPGVRWRRDGYLPSGNELAAYLARAYRYPSQRVEPNRSLVRIAQYAHLRAGRPQLFRDLQAVFAVAQRPNEVHRFIAEQPRRQRRRGLPNPWPVIVTTNYDDRLEQAFRDIREPYDLVVFNGAESASQPFRHRDPSGIWRAVAPSRSYDAFAPRVRPVILKLHGGIDTHEGTEEHFVITEDHYMSFLAHDVSRRLPSSLLILLQEASFVFLGYRLEDWNVRVFLSRIGRERDDRSVWWAFQRRPNDVDVLFWESHNVRLVALDLHDWDGKMRAAIRRAGRGGGPGA
jgi:hypothetical protein